MVQLDKYTDEQGRTWRNIVAENGTEFKVRVAKDNDDCEEYIGSYDMENKIYDNDCIFYRTDEFKDAEQIDNVICFYVSNEELELSEEEFIKVLEKDCPEVFGED